MHLFFNILLPCQSTEANIYINHIDQRMIYENFNSDLVVQIKLKEMSEWNELSNCTCIRLVSLF